jgi:hypothetical protein
MPPTGCTEFPEFATFVLYMVSWLPDGPRTRYLLRKRILVRISTVFFAQRRLDNNKAAVLLLKRTLNRYFPSRELRIPYDSRAQATISVSPEGGVTLLQCLSDVW